MSALVVHRTVASAVAAHGREAYPEEACGFLLGAGPCEGSERRVRRILRSVNEAPADRGRRYLIPPRALRSVEARFVDPGESVQGFYHSHPDHPARPSAYDAQRAFPGYLYLILSVRSDREGEMAAFELDETTGRLAPVRLVLADGEPATPVGGAVPAGPTDRAPLAVEE